MYTCKDMQYVYFGSLFLFKAYAIHFSNWLLTRRPTLSLLCTTLMNLWVSTRSDSLPPFHNDK